MPTQPTRVLPHHQGAGARIHEGISCLPWKRSPYHGHSNMLRIFCSALTHHPSAPSFRSAQWRIELRRCHV